MHDPKTVFDEAYHQRYGDDPTFPISNLGLPPQHTAQSIYDSLKDVRYCLEQLAEIKAKKLRQDQDLHVPDWQRFCERWQERLTEGKM